MGNIINISDSNVNAGGNNNDINNQNGTEQINQQIKLITKQVKQIDELIVLIKLLINKTL